MLKVNVDAIIYEDYCIIGLGWVVGDDSGSFCSAVGMPASGVLSPRNLR